jgi:phosphoserine phosphatase RsbU/P
VNTSLLARIPMFSDLPAEELTHLLENLEVLEAEPGTLIFREGDFGDRFYVVVAGELEILMAAGTSDELLLNVIGPGEYLGEMSLVVPGGQRSASVRARRPSVLLTMHRSEFNDLLRRHPLLACGMVRVLSERLGSTNEATFRDLTEKNRQLQTAYDELKDAQAQIIEKERLERELQVAAGIQMSILPARLPEPPGYDFGGCMVPARLVGGDFYDVFPVGPHTVGVVVGDVADKGIPSAIFMARTHALISAEAARGGTPGDVLRQVNLFLNRIERSDQFVTALYGILDCRSGEFAYARAGHEPPLALSPDGQVERLPHKPGQPLGILEDIMLDETALIVAPGAALLLYTDGLTDCRNLAGEPFGLERVMATVGGLSGRSAQETCDQTLGALTAYRQGSPQDDDITLVALRAVSK